MSLDVKVDVQDLYIEPLHDWPALHVYWDKYTTDNCQHDTRTVAPACHRQRFRENACRPNAKAEISQDMQPNKTLPCMLPKAVLLSVSQRRS